MERRLSISAFRNIGFQDEKPSKEGLVLNHSLEKGKMGDLVILIGANNSGKSNVLSALLAYKNKKILERDVTDLYMEQECREPFLKLSCKDEDDQYVFSISKNNETFVAFPGIDDPFNPTISLDFNNKNELTNEAFRILKTEEYLPQNSRKLTERIREIYNNPNSTNKDYESLFVDLTKIFIEYLNDKTGTYSKFISLVIPNSPFFASIYNQFNIFKKKSNEKHTLEGLNKAFSKTFGYNFEPNILEYKEEKLTIIR